MNAARILALTLLATASFGAPAQADDFYQGKTLSLVVGYSAGGGYDINARLISRHFGRHIPGNPGVVVVELMTYTLSPMCMSWWPGPLAPS